MLSEHALRCAARIFRPDELPEVIRIIEEGCGEDKDRLPCAVLKNSGGTVAGLVEAVRQVKIDYRDVLMAAGFGLDVNAHKQWHGEL